MNRAEREKAKLIALGTVAVLLALWAGAVLVSEQLEESRRTPVADTSWAAAKPDTDPLTETLETTFLAAVTAWAAALLVIGLVFGAFTALVANARRRSPIRWFVLGFFFGFIPLIALAIMGPTGKQCPECRERIDPLARVCPHCRAKQGA